MTNARLVAALVWGAGGWGAGVWGAELGCAPAARASPPPPRVATAADPAPVTDLAAAAPPWTRPRAPVLDGPIPGTTGLSAERCGDCHAEIQAEWAASTHAHAWVDPQFQKELHKDPEVAWLCLNCHTPLSNQQPELSGATGSVRAPTRTPNPAFDAALRDEGITCLSCHWRPEGIAAAHQGVQAPHPTIYDPTLRTEQACVGCHQAVARLEDALVCTFDTGAEWAAAAPGKSCPECHMPRVTRSVAPGAPAREGGRHLWPGSLLPKDEQTPAEAERFADWQPGIDASVALEPAAPGRPALARIQLTNARAGHMLPTGDPERYLEVHATVRGADGAPLAAEAWRIGQVWEWWPVARRVSDNRLSAGEVRTLTLPFVMPAGAVTAELTVEHVRISPENHAYHALGAYPPRRTVVEVSARAEPTP